MGTRLLTLILTTVRNDAVQRLIESTWGERSGDHIYLTDLPITYPTSTDKKPPSQLGLTTDTRYFSNEAKVVNGLNSAVRDLADNYDWILLCEDDTVPNFAAVEQALPGLNPGNVHGRIMYNRWGTNLTLDYPSIGAGLLLPMPLLDTLPPFEDHNTGYAEASCGLWFRKHAVPLQYSGFRAFHPQLFELDMYDESHHANIREQWSFHYVRQPNEIVKLHTIFHGE